MQGECQDSLSFFCIAQLLHSGSQLVLGSKDAEAGCMHGASAQMDSCNGHCR